MSFDFLKNSPCHTVSRSSDRDFSLTPLPGREADFQEVYLAASRCADVSDLEWRTAKSGYVDHVALSLRAAEKFLS